MLLLGNRPTNCYLIATGINCTTFYQLKWRNKKTKKKKKKQQEIGDAGIGQQEHNSVRKAMIALTLAPTSLVLIIAHYFSALLASSSTNFPRYLSQLNGNPFFDLSTPHHPSHMNLNTRTHRHTRTHRRTHTLMHRPSFDAFSCQLFFYNLITITHYHCSHLIYDLVQILFCSNFYYKNV